MLITFIMAIISIGLSIVATYYIMFSKYIKGLIRDSTVLKLMLVVIASMFFVAFNFILASIAPTIDYAETYTKFAVITLRFSILIFFILSEIVRGAKHLFAKVMISSTIFGATVITYSMTISSFSKLFGFWERTGFVNYGLINIVDLTLAFILVLSLIVSLFLTGFSMSSRIRFSEKRRIVLKYYLSVDAILLGGTIIFVLNKIINFGVFINNVLILTILSLVALTIAYFIHSNPYILYIGGARLLGLMLVEHTSGLLVYERNFGGKAPLVSGAFWAIMNMFKNQLNKHPTLIVLEDNYVVLSYTPPLIGIFIFDNYVDILPYFVQHVSKSLVNALKEKGLIGGIVVEDKELREKITEIINKTLDPFIA